MSWTRSRWPVSPHVYALFALGPIVVSGCGTAAPPTLAASPGFGGSYVGELVTPAGPRSFSVEIPAGANGDFAVTGVLTDGDGAHRIVGTARLVESSITLEVAPVNGSTEDLIGMSGEVTPTRDAIVMGRQSDRRTLVRR